MTCSQSLGDIRLCGTGRGRAFVHKHHVYAESEGPSWSTQYVHYRRPTYALIHFCRFRRVSPCVWRSLGIGARSLID
jgi:hypothetical protein